MTRIKRLYVQGYPYFITSVTHDRTPILINGIESFWQAIESVNQRRQFELIAWVILPEHIHLMIDPKDHKISDVLQPIKKSFSMRYLYGRGVTGPVWQQSYWDHAIRDEKDYYNHLNYIHINPVKHGLVNDPFDWPHSSIHKFKDFYPEGWGRKVDIESEGEFGE